MKKLLLSLFVLVISAVEASEVWYPLHQMAVEKLSQAEQQERRIDSLTLGDGATFGWATDLDGEVADKLTAIAQEMAERCGWIVAGLGESVNEKQQCTELSLLFLVDGTPSEEELKQGCYSARDEVIARIGADTVLACYVDLKREGVVDLMLFSIAHVAALLGDTFRCDAYQPVPIPGACHIYSFEEVKGFDVRSAICGEEIILQIHERWYVVDVDQSR